MRDHDDTIPRCVRCGADGWDTRTGQVLCADCSEFDWDASQVDPVDYFDAYPEDAPDTGMSIADFLAA